LTLPFSNPQEELSIVSDDTAALRTLLTSISQAEREFGRAPGSVRLTIASKQQDATRLEPLILAGHRLFGENRVQEAAAKWPELKNKYPNLELHLIGPLQTNKTAAAVALFDVIETLDRPSLAESLAKELPRSGRHLTFYVQVNTGGELQKAGVSPEEVDSFITLCRDDYRLDVRGLMCIPPVSGHVSPHFALLAQIAKRNNLKQLSMGMSSDYKLAIQLGATTVRVGSALFGNR
jgi:pyridoxal phosphate enzyme (YggS family)